MNIKTEALIIGAGPVGLFQAFELGLLGIDCCIVESLNRPGGQCTELYPDKPIYDIPGTTYTTAAKLIEQLQLQLKPFNTRIEYQQTAKRLERTPTGFNVETTAGDQFEATTVFLATGAGAFTPVKLRTEGLSEFEGSQVHYEQWSDEQYQQHIKGKKVTIAGDAQEAVDCAIHASKLAVEVTLLHRKRRLDASTEALQQLAQLTEQKKVLQIKGKITGFNCSTQGTLEELVIQQSTDNTSTQAVDHLLVRQGNSPKQVDLESWGIDTQARHIPVDTANYESGSPGIYAIGDINSYPAKRKLILCGFHEATLAAFAATAKLRPEKPVHLQYTTTSTELKKRLGVVSTTNPDQSL